MMFQEIADTDVLDFTLGLQLYESLPSFDTLVLVADVFRFQVGSSRPMNQDEVQVLAIQVLEDGLNSLPRFVLALLLGTDFTRDVKLLSRYSRLLQHLSNFGFVLIHAGRINVSIASLQSRPNSSQAVLFTKLIGAIADHGDLSAGVQCQSGQCRQGGALHRKSLFVINEMPIMTTHRVKFDQPQLIKIQIVCQRWTDFGCLKST